jgi:hypothetical protein
MMTKPAPTDQHMRERRLVVTVDDYDEALHLYQTCWICRAWPAGCRPHPGDGSYGGFAARTPDLADAGGEVIASPRRTLSPRPLEQGLQVVAHAPERIYLFIGQPPRLG